MNHIEVNQITKIDELRNELDIQYSQSMVLKLIVTSGINYQIIPASLRNFIAKLLYKNGYTKYSGLDPEVSGGIDNNIFPRPRTFVLGLNINFK